MKASMCEVKWLSSSRRWYQIFFALLPTWNDCLTSFFRRGFSSRMGSAVALTRRLQRSSTQALQLDLLPNQKPVKWINVEFCKHHWVVNLACGRNKCHVPLTQPSGVCKDMDQVEVVCAKAEEQCERDYTYLHLHRSGHNY